MNRLLNILRWLFGLPPKVQERNVSNVGVTALIAAFNEERDIWKTLESLYYQTADLEEIIVVDDCSTDRTAKVVRAFQRVCQGVPISILTTPKNTGFKANAQNFGLPYVKTELVLTVDADTIVAHDAVAKMLQHFKNPRVKAVSGFPIPRCIETVWERGRFVEYLLALTVYKPAQNHIGAVLVASGCCALYDTATLREIGFNPTNVAEDMALTWEMIARGYVVRYEPNSFCYPVEPSTRKVFDRQLSRWYGGFLQCIDDKSFSFKKTKILGFLVYLYLFGFSVAPIFMMGMAAIAFTDSWPIAALYFGWDAIVNILICSYQGIRIKMFGKCITSLPAFYVTRFVSAYIFWRALWRDKVKGQRICQWAKGH